MKKEPVKPVVKQKPVVLDGINVNIGDSIVFESVVAVAKQTKDEEDVEMKEETPET